MEWLERKKGHDYVSGMYMMNDREVKRHFNNVYKIYKDSPDYAHNHKDFKMTCLVCDDEIEITWLCACGENEAIVDENDPELPERLREKSK